MLIQKYKAKIMGSDTELIGYIIENKKHIGQGCFSEEIQYTIVVNDFTMPISKDRGCFYVEKDSIEIINLESKNIKNVKDIILDYCQGINHLEFALTDLEEIVNKIDDYYEKQTRSTKITTDKKSVQS